MFVRLFSSLCTDETPMVRRSAATKFPDFLKVVGKVNALKDLLAALHKLAGDEQDSVRLLSIHVLLAFAELCEIEERKGVFLPILRSLYSDKSWRVRYVVAEKYVSVCNVFVHHIYNY